MKKLFLSLAIIAFTISAAFAQTVTKNYKFGNITGIHAGYVFNVKVTKGNSDKIEVICPDHLQSYLNISSSNGVLNLSVKIPKNYHQSNHSSQEIIVNMQMSTIKSIELSGASRFNAVGEFSTDDIIYNLSGASKVTELNINGRYAKLDCSGASSISQKGNFENMNLDCSGASRMAINGDINNITGEISGATNFSYNGTSKQISMELSGASKAILKGAANTLNAYCSGASYINAKELITADVTVEASGASKLNVYASNRLKADATSGAIVNYSGNPKEVISRPTNIRKAD